MTLFGKHGLQVEFFNVGGTDQAANGLIIASANNRNTLPPAISGFPPKRGRIHYTVAVD